MKKLLLLLMLMLPVLSASALEFEYGYGIYETNGVIDSEFGYPQVVCKRITARGKSQTTLTLNGVVEYNNTKYRCYSIYPLICENNTTVETLRLGYGIVEIGHDAFRGCTNLSTVNIPSSVKTIYAYAFYGTKSSVVNMPRDPETTPLPTFYTDCFTSISYLNSGTEPASQAAKANSFLKGVVTYYQSVPSQANDYTLKHGDDYYYFVVTKSPTKSESGSSALIGTSGTTIELTSYSDVTYRSTQSGMPNNVTCTKIPKKAFYQRGSITSINIARDMEIGDSSFFYHTDLTSLKLSGSGGNGTQGVKIGTGAFAGCTAGYVSNWWFHRRLCIQWMHKPQRVFRHADTWRVCMVQSYHFR